ncbi:MAG TPA: phosphate ABC transporter ATP-binding protein PstB [Rectinemataceae bacterium]|nr:phosphate ABC transporter ATP-binding protein PstB [Rectinemataceae bacterium]
MSPNEGQATGAEASDGRMMRSLSDVIQDRGLEQRVEQDLGKGIQIRGLSAFYGTHQALEGIDFDINPGVVTAIIGPSGCGKSTMIRCLNRMHEVIRGASVTGSVLVDGQDIYAPDANPTRVRRNIGMVFQKPNPFPTRSIYENVITGLRLNMRRKAKHEYDEVVEKSLRAVALWDEVKDKLHDSGTALSGGQQQRLCIARAIAIEPEILLLDEPASALDPTATMKIEDLLFELKTRYTIVLVTHNMQQAARASDITAFFLADERHIGHLVESGPTRQIFMTPSDKRTEDYISGRLG